MAHIPVRVVGVGGASTGDDGMGAGVVAGDGERGSTGEDGTTVGAGTTGGDEGGGMMGGGGVGGLAVAIGVTGFGFGFDAPGRPHTLEPLWKKLPPPTQSRHACFAPPDSRLQPL